MSLLEIKDLTIHYVTHDGVVRAVNNINLDIGESRTVGLVGETGAGKTTTALGIMNLIPDPPGKVIGGEIFFEGRDLLKTSDSEMRLIRGNEISMIFQDPMTALNPIIRVGEQIAEVIRLHGDCSKSEAMQRSLAMLPASEKNSSTALSLPGHGCMTFRATARSKFNPSALKTARRLSEARQLTRR